MDRGRSAGALLALAACIACATAAPTLSNDTALDTYDADASDGCYYNFQHYGEGDRIMTNEPCLNCTCHNRMLMCYLRVCPFTKPIGQDCTIEKRADQCCPIITCPDVPVDLLTSTSTTSPAEYGATGVGHLDKYGCSIHGKYYPEGSKVPPSPNKPCEHCYCIRNMTTCVMQECTLHVDGCTPIYLKDVCCPVRYSCDHDEDEPLMLDHMTTTIGTTPGIKWATTTLAPAVSQECIHGDETFPDGALIKTEKACEHCYCMKGDIVCVVQECGTPMENEGKNCTSLTPREGQCCPDTYICEGDNEITTDVMTSISPPRRTEEGYRSETDEQVTTDKIVSEPEGSGGYENKSEEPSHTLTTDFTEGEVSVTTEKSKITTAEYESGEVHHTIIPPEYLPESTSTSKPIEHEDPNASSTTEPDVQKPSDHEEPTYHTQHEEYSTHTMDDKEIEPSTTEGVIHAETTVATTYSDYHVDKGLSETTDLENPNVTTTPEKAHDITPESTDLPDKESTQDENVTEKQEKLPEIDDHIKLSTTEKTEYEQSTLIPKTDEPIVESSTHEPVGKETNQPTIITESHDSSETTTKLFISEHTETSLPDVTSEDVNIITSTEFYIKDKYSTITNKEPIEETTSEIQQVDDHTTTTEKEPFVTQSTHKVQDEEDTEKPTESDETFSQVTTEINVSDGFVTDDFKPSDETPEKETGIPLASTTIKESDETLTTVKHEEPFSAETTINPFEFTTLTHKDNVQESEVTSRADIEKPQETTTKYDQITETTFGTKDESATGTTKTPEEEKPHVEHTDEAITTTSDTLHEKYTESTVEPDKGLNTIPLEPDDEDHTMTVEAEDSKETKKPEGDLTTPPTNVPDDLFTTLETEDETSILQTTEKSDLHADQTESTAIVQDELSVTPEPHDISSSTPKDVSVEGDTSTETLISIEQTTTDHTPKDSTSDEVPVKGTTIIFDSETTSDGIIVTTTDKPDVNIAENEVDEDIVPPISSPGVIPGEGSCLVDGVTYNNNSVLPSSNKCQSACKCMSSIIKCELIQCSPPPENMMNCQSVYDSTDSCCPTYICDTIKETIPPQPHSQMAVTEPAIVETDCGEDCHKTDSKLPVDKCDQGQCEVVEEPIVPQKQPELCTTDNCAVPSHVVPEEPIKESPTEHTPVSLDEKKPTDIECTEQNGCLPEHSIDSNLPCIGEDCRRHDLSQPESPTKDCAGDECKAEDSTTPVSSYVTEKDKECGSDVECKKPEMESASEVTTNTQHTLSEETTSLDDTTHKLIDEPQTTVKPKERPDIIPPTLDHTIISESTTELESQTEDHTIIPDFEVKPELVTVYPDVVTITPQSQSTVIMSMETKATDTSDVSNTTKHPHLPESLDITQSLPTDTEKSTEEVATSPTLSPVISEATAPTNEPMYTHVENVTPTEEQDIKVTELIPHETESSISEDTVTEGTETEHTVSQGAITHDTALVDIVTEGVVSEGAVTEGSVTEGVITEGFVNPATVTEGAVSEGTITEGADSESAVTEKELTKYTRTEESVTKGSISGDAVTEISVTEKAETEKSATEGAATESSVTEKAATEGAAIKGDVTESGVTEKAATEGAAIEGDTTGSDVTEKAVTEGAANEGDATESGVTEKTATEGVAIEKDATESGVTNKVATEGAAIEGDATESGVTEKAATEGAAIERDSTESSVTDKVATEGAAIEGDATKGSATESAVTDGSVTKGHITEVAVTKEPIPESSLSEEAVTTEIIGEGVTDKIVSVSESLTTEAEINKDTITEASATETSVTKSHITKDIVTKSEDSVTKNIVTESAITENIVVAITELEEVATEGTVSEGAVSEGAVSEGAVSEGAVSEGTATEGAATEREFTRYTGIEESTTKSSISEGSVTEGAVSEGIATEGAISEGATESASAEGVITQEIHHEDTSSESHTEPVKEYSETTESIATTGSVLTGDIKTETTKDSTSTEGQPQEDNFANTESPFTSTSAVEDETSVKHEQDESIDKATTTHSPEPLYTERIDLEVTKENVETEATVVTSEYPSLVKETTTEKDFEHETQHPLILPTTQDIVTPDEKINKPTEVTGATTKIPFTDETTVYVHDGELEATAPKTTQEPSSDRETIIPVSLSEGTTESSVQITETTSDNFIPLKEGSTVLPDSEYHTSTTTKEYGEAQSTDVPEITGPQDVTFKESEVPTHHTEPSILSTEVSDNQEKVTTTADAVNITELPATTLGIVEDHTVKDTVTTYDDSAKETTAEPDDHVQTITEQKTVEETTKHINELEHTAIPVEATTVVPEQTVDDTIPVEPSISPPTDSESVTDYHFQDTTKHETETEKYDEDMISHHPTIPQEQSSATPQISETTLVPTHEQETVKADDDLKESTTSKPVEISTSDYTSQSESDITTEGVDISSESHSEMPKPHEPPLASDEEHKQVTDKPELPALPTSTEYTEIPKITVTPDEEPFKHSTTDEKLYTDKVHSESPSPADVITTEHVETVESLPSSTEKQKPISTDKPSSEEIPSTEDDTEAPDQFPPSGTSGYGQEPEYEDSDQAFGPGTCRYGGKVYVSAQQIPRDDPCDFCFCFRSDIICLQQSCPPPIHGCHEEPIQGFCCPRYECPVSMATSVNMTTTTTTTTTTLPPHFLPHAYHGAAQRKGCQIKGHSYEVGEVVRASSGPCLHCTCGGDGQMKCDPKICTPEPMLRQMIAAAVSSKRRR